jgi:acetyl esterase
MSTEPTPAPDPRIADDELAAWLAPFRKVARAERTVDLALLRDPRPRSSRPRGPELAAVRDERPAGHCATRRYAPDATEATVVFVHGGGWVIGDLDSHDRLCRMLAAETGACVVAVDYRRAPEHPWPAAVHDVLAVIAAEQTRTGRPLVVAGDSAGGTLAILACLAAIDAGVPSPAGLSLACPNTDLTLTWPSITTFGRGWSLDVEALRFFVEAWAPDPEDRRRGDVSPLYAEDLERLPPTHIATAELDPLGDEGRAFADRLAAAGVLAGHRDEPGLIHGFVMLDRISPAAERATERWIAATARLLIV